MPATCLESQGKYFGPNFTSLFTCNSCPYNTNYKSDLTRHKRTHYPEKRFKCPKPGCKYATRQNSNFQTHLRTHTGERSQACPHEGCTYKTHDPSCLTRHRKRKHNYVPIRRGSRKSTAAVSPTPAALPASTLVAPSFDTFLMPSSSQGVFATSFADLMQMPANDYTLGAFAEIPSNPLFDDSMYPEPCAAEIFEGIWDHVSPGASCEPEVPQMVAPTMQFGGMLEPFEFFEGDSSSSTSAQYGFDTGYLDSYSRDSREQSTFDEMWNSFVTF